MGGLLAKQDSRRNVGLFRLKWAVRRIEAAWRREPSEWSVASEGSRSKAEVVATAGELFALKKKVLDLESSVERLESELAGKATLLEEEVL